MNRMIINDEPRAYRVRWEFDIASTSPQHAARGVAQMFFNHQIQQGRPDSPCTFDVLGYRCKQGETWLEETQDKVNLYSMGADMSAESLQELYGYEGHPVYGMTKWQSEVLNHTTVEGYWGWLRQKINFDVEQRAQRAEEQGQ